MATTMRRDIVSAEKEVGLGLLVGYGAVGRGGGEPEDGRGVAEEEPLVGDDHGGGLRRRHGRSLPYRTNVSVTLAENHGLVICLNCSVLSWLLESGGTL